jgi:hypothetical protein
MSLGSLLGRELAEWGAPVPGLWPVAYVCFERDKDLGHGNFLPVAYRTILITQIADVNPNCRRLQKVRLQGRKCRQNTRMESGG